MSNENIKNFLMAPEESGAYTDEKLAELLAHAQDGKLSYWSCCCLIGVPTADHALRGKLAKDNEYGPHTSKGRMLPFGERAEIEFAGLGNDAQRRECLIPLILAEMERREQKRNTAEYQTDSRDEEGATDTRPEIEVYRGR